MSDALAVSVSPPRLSVDPGGSAQVTLQLRNHSAVVDEYAVEVLGEAAAWTALDRTRVAVFPEGLETVQATMKPPREPFPAAGDVPVGFRIRSTVDPQQSVVEECHLDVRPFVEIGGELRPKTAKGRFSATHNLRVINRGNAPVSVSVRAEVQQGDVEVSVPPAPLVVGVGARGTTKVKVRPSGSHWSGADEMHTYRLNLVPQGGTPVAIDAMMRQRPIARIPATALVAAALLVGGAYFLHGSGSNPLQQAAHWAGKPDVSQSPSSAPTLAPTAGPTLPPGSSPPPPGQCTVGTPSNVSATAGNAQATVSWVAPPPICAVTGYTVTASPGGSHTSAGPSDLSAAVSGLTNCTQYTFVVTANGAGGPGSPSAHSNPVTPFTVLGPPVGVTAVAGDTTATVTWKVPAVNCGAAITQYMLTSSPAGAMANVSVNSAGGSATVTNLANDTSYTFSIVAVNSAGPGPAAVSNAVIPRCVALSNLTITTTPWNVYWRANGTCSPYSGTVHVTFTYLIGGNRYSTYPFSASGSNPSGVVGWSAPTSFNNGTIFDVTLQDGHGNTVTAHATR